MSYCESRNSKLKSPVAFGNIFSVQSVPFFFIAYSQLLGLHAVKQSSHQLHLFDHFPSKKSLLIKLCRLDPHPNPSSSLLNQVWLPHGGSSFVSSLNHANTGLSFALGLLHQFPVGQSSLRGSFLHLGRLKPFTDQFSHWLGTFFHCFGAVGRPERTLFGYLLELQPGRLLGAVPGPPFAARRVTRYGNLKARKLFERQKGPEA